MAQRLEFSGTPLRVVLWTWAKRLALLRAVRGDANLHQRQFGCERAGKTGADSVDQLFLDPHRALSQQFQHRRLNPVGQWFLHAPGVGQPPQRLAARRGRFYLHQRRLLNGLPRGVGGKAERGWPVGGEGGDGGQRPLAGQSGINAGVEQRPRGRLPTLLEGVHYRLLCHGSQLTLQRLRVGVGQAF